MTESETLELLRQRHVLARQRTRLKRELVREADRAERDAGRLTRMAREIQACDGLLAELTEQLRPALH
jgi:hypothetical protein